MDTGSTAWILASSALVAVMLPGLALYYGGMTSSKTTLNMLMMVFGAFSVATVLWVLYGYSAVFGDSMGGLGLLGNVSEYPGLAKLMVEDPSTTLPPMLFAAFQALFAAITVAIIAGGVADRMKFGAWMVFAGLWVTLVYLPVAHWVFAFDSADGSVLGGWIANKLGAVDFAGGTAVHINSGAATLALVLVLGRRMSWARPPRPHNLPLVILGAGLLWFGWFGFNAGSALAAGHAASVVFMNTLVAACAGTVAWLAAERLRYGHATSLGAASGAVAGLVAITPGCGAVNPIGAIAIGAAAGVACMFGVNLKRRYNFDDSLDVVGVHLVGGILGTLLIGLFATDIAPNAVNGLFYGGGLELFGIQAVATVAVLVYSFVVTWLIAVALRATMGIRLSVVIERGGVDVGLHAESAYDLVPGASISGGGLPHPEVTIAAKERSAAATTA